MMPIHPGCSLQGEHLPYYSQYIDLAPAGNIVDLLTEQLAATGALLAPLSADQVNFRPKPEDWKILEVLGHMADSERVFAYRALCVARNDATPLPSFDQDHFVANADFASRTLTDLLDEFATVRHATLSLFRTLSAEAWVRQGITVDHPITPPALAYVIAGHELHHVADKGKRDNHAETDLAAG